MNGMISWTIPIVLAFSFAAPMANAENRYCWVYENTVDTSGKTVRLMLRAGEIDEADFRASNLPNCEKSRKYDDKIYHFCSNYVVRIFEKRVEIKQPSYGWNCGRPPGKTINLGNIQTNFVKKGFRIDK